MDPLYKETGIFRHVPEKRTCPHCGNIFAIGGACPCEERGRERVIEIDMTGADVLRTDE